MENFSVCYNNASLEQQLLHEHDYTHIMRICKVRRMHVKQKQLGCKKVRDQSEARVSTSDKNV